MWPFQSKTLFRTLQACVMVTSVYSSTKRLHPRTIDTEVNAEFHISSPVQEVIRASSSKYKSTSLSNSPIEDPNGENQRAGHRPTSIYFKEVPEVLSGKGCQGEDPLPQQRDFNLNDALDIFQEEPTNGGTLEHYYHHPYDPEAPQYQILYNPTHNRDDYLDAKASPNSKENTDDHKQKPLRAGDFVPMEPQPQYFQQQGSGQDFRGKNDFEKNGGFNFNNDFHVVKEELMDAETLQKYYSHPYDPQFPHYELVHHLPQHQVFGLPDPNLHVKSSPDLKDTVYDQKRRPDGAATFASNNPQPETFPLQSEGFGTEKFELVRSWNLSTPEQAFAKLLSLAVYGVFKNRQGFEMTANAETETQISQAIELLNYNLAEEIPLVKKLDMTRKALLEEMVRSPVPGKKWISLFKVLEIKTKFFQKKLEGGDFQELGKLYPKRKITDTYIQRFRQADMHHELEDLEVLYRSAHGRLGDVCEGIPIDQGTKRKIHTLPSDPESSRAKRLKQEKYNNHMVGTIGNKLNQKKNTDNDFIHLNYILRFKPMGKTGFQIMAQSVFLDGFLFARIKAAYESQDHPEFQSIISFASIANTIKLIYENSMCLIHTKSSSPVSFFTAEKDAFRRVLATFTYFTRIIFQSPRFGNCLFDGTLMAIYALEQTKNFPTKPIIIEHLEVIRQLFMDPMNDYLGRLQVFQGGSKAIDAKIKKIMKEPPKGIIYVTEMFQNIKYHQKQGIEIHQNQRTYR
ncbi:hypothetical protein PGT21_005978 [Puccinia graminis f. sp. tritici]|uniref:Uncharacterized protein n=1 Tax=Puccinia graminis f. sp. tritici TaxID=56615 RepID=A0A5B0Q4R2_PUCGR|nr:hypothetical protein PGT21_005978 [Puccinia graminis f. sp. tritici]